MWTRTFLFLERPQIGWSNDTWQFVRFWRRGTAAVWLDKAVSAWSGRPRSVGPTQCKMPVNHPIGLVGCSWKCYTTLPISVESVSESASLSLQEKKKKRKSCFTVKHKHKTVEQLILIAQPYLCSCSSLRLPCLLSSLIGYEYNMQRPTMIRAMGAAETSSFKVKSTSSGWEQPLLM